MHAVQSQVSELALCKEGEGTHDWIFPGIVEPACLTAQLPVWSDQVPPIVVSFNKYLVSISYVSEHASGKDSQMKDPVPALKDLTFYRQSQTRKQTTVLCVCLNRGMCKGLWDYRGMKVGLPGGDNLDLCFERRVRVDAGKAKRAFQTRKLA